MGQGVNKPEGGRRAKRGTGGTPAKAPRPHAVGTGISLDTQAYQTIKDLILTLYFLPGQYVNEGGIAALIGMGRTPVHQAMQRLQLEELVEIVPRKGVIIRPDSVAEILKILDSRETVEPELARHAAARATVEEAAELRELALAADQPADARVAAIEAFTRADRAFHARVAQLSDNKVMAEFASLLHDRCMRFWYLHLWQTLDTKSTTLEHLEVSDAVASRDCDAASAAMRHHIRSLKERVGRIQSAAPLLAARPAQPR